MEDRFKFRAWAEHRVDTGFKKAWEEKEEKFNKKEPSKNSDSWSEWYDEGKIYLDKKVAEYKDFPITKTKLMIDDSLFSIGKINITAFGYKLIDIMQCTGLKDKNGKLIYEGDIVQIGKKIWNVAYNTIECRYRLEHPDEIAHINKWNADQSEIVGNIHESPELLNKRED